MIRNRLVTFFDLFDFGFGFGKFRIAVLGLRRRFNSVLRVRHFAIELVQATGAVFNRIPVNADRSIATTQRVAFFTDFIDQGREHLRVFFGEFTQAVHILFTRQNIALHFFQKRFGICNFVLAGERARRRNAKRHKATCTHNRIGGDKIQVLATVFLRQIECGLQRVHNKIARENTRKPRRNFVVRLHKIFERTDNARITQLLVVSRGRTRNKRHEHLAHIFALERIYNFVHGTVAIHDNRIKNFTESGFDARCVFRRRLDAFRNKTANEVRLVFLEVTVGVRAFVHHALEHVNSRLQACFFVL